MFEIPSYSIFSDGIYPPSYPLNPNHPQNPLPPVLNRGRQYRLTPRQLATANNHVRLVNNERAPINIDFKIIADALREIRW